MAGTHLDERGVSIVIPAFNEAARLTRTLPRIRSYADRGPTETEIVVVDDGSRDGTATVARRLLAGHRSRVCVLERNFGKGRAFRRGVEESGGRWVLLTDADLSTPIETLDRLLDVAAAQAADLVIGSRQLDRDSVEVRQGPLRRFLGAGYRALNGTLTGIPFRDTQCGFKLLRRSTVAPIVRRMQIDGFAFDVELLYLALRAGLRVEEVAVPWRNDEASKVRLFVDPARMAWDTAGIRWKHRRRSASGLAKLRTGPEEI